MGNKAIETMREKAISVGSIPDQTISSIVSTSKVTLKTKSHKSHGGYNWFYTSEYGGDETGSLVASIKQASWKHPGTKIIYDDDKDDANILAVSKVKSGFKDRITVYRPTPAYEGQEAVPGVVKTDGWDLPLYPFAVITVSGMMDVTAAYHLVTGSDGEDERGKPVLVLSNPVYAGKKANSMRFAAAVEDAGGNLLVRVEEKKMLSNGHIAEIGEGVDVVAALLLATSMDL